MLKNLYSLIALLVLVATFSSTNSFADIYSCNGVITNKPCTDDTANNPTLENKPILKETIRPPLTEEDIERQRKQRMLYNFDAFRLASQTSYGIIVDYEAIRNICFESSLSECEKLIQERRAYVEDQKYKLIELKDKLEKEAQEREEKRLIDKKSAEQENNTNITIINDNSLNINRGINVIPRFGRRNRYSPIQNPYYTPDYSGYKVPATAVPTVPEKYDLKIPDRLK